MYTKRLKKDDWLLQSLSFLKMANQQFRQRSQEGISFHVDDTSSHPAIFIKCPHRQARIAMESFINELLQGICYVKNNTELEWLFTL